MEDVIHRLIELVVALKDVLIAVLAVLLRHALLIAWLAWSLGGINWRRSWPVLAGGAWVPASLGLIASALAWSQLAPSDCTCLQFVRVENFWWQLGAVSLVAALTLVCGWLQGILGWAPAELNLQPAHHADHGLEHDHAHGNSQDEGEVHHGRAPPPIHP